MPRICLGRSRNCFVRGFGFQVIGEKTLSWKDFTRNLREIFTKKMIVTIISTNVVKFTVIPFLSFCRNQKKNESNFQQVGGLVTRNSFAFCLERVARYFKDMPNSIDFYKRIFLHVIPACILVSCLNKQCKIIIDFLLNVRKKIRLCLLTKCFKSNDE